MYFRRTEFVPLKSLYIFCNTCAFYYFVNRFDIYRFQFLGRLFPTLLGRHTFQMSPTRWPVCSCGRLPSVRHSSNENTNNGDAGLGRKFVPRRAMLYVPGNDERKLKKIPMLDLDCVVMDCEDGVALNRKVRK